MLTVSLVSPSTAAPRLARLGFLVEPNLGHHVDGGYLLVALRGEPSLHHFDPERVEYWQTVESRGEPARLTRDTSVAIDTEFSWGTISLVDRLGVANDYLTFGGHLAADRVGGALVAVFTSRAPILKGGGHSQEWDLAGASVGAFFGRLLLAVDIRPGVEAALASATPLARYGAFIASERIRYLSSPGLRDAQPALWTMLEREDRWLRLMAPADFVAGDRLWRNCTMDGMPAT